jgi:hypothetical protein
MQLNQKLCKMQIIIIRLDLEVNIFYQKLEFLKVNLVPITPNNSIFSTGFWFVYYFTE